jgi:hypothetical protein
VLINEEQVRRVCNFLREMLRLDGRSRAMTSAVSMASNPPEPHKAKNQPVGWFF